jgi:GNAT superfamily N-acetyltransferase
MSQSGADADWTIRPLTGDDLDRVVAIDRSYSGHGRRGFFEKRLAAASAQPQDFIHVGAVRGDRLYGFAMARILRGEFGQAHAVAVLDGLGVEAESRHRGLGRALLGALTQSMRRMGIGLLQSQAVWTDHDLLRFFAAAGFRLAPRIALQRAVTEPIDEPYEDV